MIRSSLLSNSNKLINSLWPHFLIVNNSKRGILSQFRFSEPDLAKGPFLQKKLYYQSVRTYSDRKNERISKESQSDQGILDPRPEKSGYTKPTIRNQNSLPQTCPKTSFKFNMAICLASIIVIYYYAQERSYKPIPMKPLDIFNDKGLIFECSKPGMPLLEDIVNKEKPESFLKKDIPELESDEPVLYVVAGESGIGKTEAFRFFVDEWKKKGLPALYISLRGPVNYSDFLLKCFSTTNEIDIRREIKKSIQVSRQPLIVLDNIDKLYHNEKFEPGILEFLRDFMEEGGKVFMVSSVNHVAYKILKTSGYGTRASVIEIEPRNDETMEFYIREKINPLRQKKLTDDEIKDFVKMFGKNMALANHILISNRTYDEVVKTEKSKVLRNIKALETNLSILALLKQLATEKGEHLADWYELDITYRSSENYQRMLQLVQGNIFINKDFSLFKFKNNFVKKVVMDYFDLPQKS